MEDPSSWESWTTPLPAGPVMDYPTGYQLPSPPRPGYIGDIRVLPQATPDAIRFAERLWP